MGDIIGRILCIFCALGIIWLLSVMGFFKDPIGTFFASDADPEDWGARISMPLGILFFLYLIYVCLAMALTDEPKGVV